jgi:hypothetical protein
MNPASQMYVTLNFSDMKDPELLALAATIAKIAPSSPLFTNPTIAAGVAGITAKAATFDTSGKKVDNLTSQLADAKTGENQDRTALQTEIRAYVGSVLNFARNEADVTGLALTPRPPVVVPTTGPSAPTSIDVVLPKHAHGYLTVSVHELGGVRGRYYAEWSPDPIGTWSTLTGTGKSRKVTGASGARIWVRFARVRGQVQSEWSTPVLVVIP